MEIQVHKSFVSATRCHSPSRNSRGGQSVFISYDGSDLATLEKVTKLKNHLLKGGKSVYEHAGEEVVNLNPQASLPDDLKSVIKASIVLVICISKEYKTNLSCQKIARYCLTQQKRAIVVFALLQCDYTTSSYPHKVSGWLAHMIKDAVTYPCYTDLQIKATSSCIEGVFVLRMKQIFVDEKEVDKFAARNAAVKKMLARHNSTSVLVSETSLNNFPKISEGSVRLNSPQRNGSMSPNQRK